MSKAKIIIEYNGNRYRASKSARCASKRDCDLYKRGVCDSSEDVYHFPCDAIGDAFIEMSGTCPNFCFKRIRSK